MHPNSYTGVPFMHLSDDKRTVRIHGLTKCAVLPAVAVAALLAFHAPAFAAEHDPTKGAAPPGTHEDHGGHDSETAVSPDARDIPPPPPRHETSDKFSKEDEKERAPPSAQDAEPRPDSDHSVPSVEGEKAKE